MGVQITVSPNGRIVIPADVRRQLGLEQGGTLILDVDEFGLRLTTAKQRVLKAQQLYRQLGQGKGTGKAPPSVDDFLEQKRKDAQRENDELENGYR